MHGRLTQQLPDPSDDLRIIRSNVTWETYERLLAENRPNGPPRLTYDRGMLEIARFTEWQESTNRTLHLIAGLVAGELRMPIRAAGLSSCMRRDLQRGFEPDSCFYIRNASGTHGKHEVEFADEAPPDLIIDVKAANSPFSKTPIFAAFGVPEIWQYDEGTDQVRILRLRNDTFFAKRESAALVPLTSDMLTQLLRHSRMTPVNAWSDELRSWLRSYD